MRCQLFVVVHHEPLLQIARAQLYGHIGEEGHISQAVAQEPKIRSQFLEWDGVGRLNMVAMRYREGGWTVESAVNVKLFSVWHTLNFPRG